MKETKIRVELIDYTGYGSVDPLFAARKLAFTKATRLNMTPGLWAEYLAKPEEEILNEIEYMVTTLPSSWEFVSATFLIMDVSRACAQQITRTRWTPMEGDIFGSYAMQAQRVVDVSDAAMYVPEHLTEGSPAGDYYRMVLKAEQRLYAQGMELYGLHPEDARGLLPMHTASNLVAEWNLRALTDLCRKRSSLRVQGEYNEVVRQMRELLLEVWPWSEPFFKPKEELASGLLEEAAREVDELGHKPLDGSFSAAARALKMKIAKAADLLKV